MRNLSLMQNSTTSFQNYLTKSHIFPLHEHGAALVLPTVDRNPLGTDREAEKTKVGMLKSTARPVFFYNLLIPSYVSFAVSVTPEGSKFVFKGNRGDLEVFIPSRFRCIINKRTIKLTSTSSNLQGEFKTVVGSLYRAMLGVTRGYRIKLKTVGVGYKAALTENRLIKMTLGYSHPVHYFLDHCARIKFSRKNNKFNLQGSNPLILNQTAADLHFFKRPDVYKGKGVRYRGYKLLKKEGKKKK
jgi:large subunit ribosomal protein L6